MIWNDSQGGMSEGSHWWLRREAAIKLANMMDDGSSKPSSDVAVLEAGEFLLGKGGRPQHTIENLELALRKLGVALWYDEFAQEYTLKIGHEAPQEMNDEAVLELRLKLQRQWELGPPRVVDWLRAIALQDRRHPMREYLDGLKWDGKPRIDAWLSTYLGAKETPYTREVGRLVLLAAVARVRQPGCKFDEMMILEGALAPLLPKVLRLLAGNGNWFADSAPIAGSGMSFNKSIIGKWIVVDTGLHELKRRDARLIHILLSSSQDRIRVTSRHLGSRLQDYPRQCILMGTTDEKRYLKKANRRFWPVETGKLEAYRLATERNQLWAEAAQRQAAGESIRMDESLWAVAAIEQEKRRLPE